MSRWTMLVLVFFNLCSKNFWTSQWKKKLTNMKKSFEEKKFCYMPMLDKSGVCNLGVGVLKIRTKELKVKWTTKVPKCDHKFAFLSLCTCPLDMHLGPFVSPSFQDKIKFFFSSTSYGWHLFTLEFLPSMKNGGLIKFFKNKF